MIGRTTDSVFVRHSRRDIAGDYLYLSRDSQRGAKTLREGVNVSHRVTLDAALAQIRESDMTRFMDSRHQGFDHSAFMIPRPGAVGAYYQSVMLREPVQIVASLIGQIDDSVRLICFSGCTDVGKNFRTLHRYRATRKGRDKSENRKRDHALILAQPRVRI